MAGSEKRFKTMDEYIKTFPKDVQVVLERVRQTIREAAPEAVETVSYQMPTFKLNGRHLVYFAAWKNHIGFYAMPSGTKAFKKELSRYKAAKGSVQFPIDEPIPYDLVAKIVAFQMKENLEAARTKSQRTHEAGRVSQQTPRTPLRVTSLRARSFPSEARPRGTPGDRKSGARSGTGSPRCPR